MGNAVQRFSQSDKHKETKNHRATGGYEYTKEAVVGKKKNWKLGVEIWADSNRNRFPVSVSSAQ